MDVLERIRQLMARRGWTEYRLVKETGLPYSTVANIFHRRTQPSIATLEKICSAFGVSLSDFFAADDPPSPARREGELLQEWAGLTEAQQTLLVELARQLSAGNRR